MKKLLSLLCSIALLFSLCVVAQAAQQTGKCGENLTWTLSEDGTLTVCGEGSMNIYTVYPWASCGEIRAVVIESGVTSVAKMAFQELPALKSVSLADSVAYIGPYAFFNCAALETVAFGTGLTTLREHAFRGCAAFRRRAGSRRRGSARRPQGCASR